MDFGSLQIATAWRVTKAGVMCQAIVMDGPQGGRLVVIEDQRIVDWKRFRMTSELREYAGETLKARRRAGWVPASPELKTDDATQSPSPGGDTVEHS